MCTCSLLHLIRFCDSRTALQQHQSGAAEAWWAHNPQVPGSKPGSDIEGFRTLFLIFFFYQNPFNRDEVKAILFKKNFCQNPFKRGEVSNFTCETNTGRSKANPCMNKNHASLYLAKQLSLVNHHHAR
uniref:Uncharacterized protein n=1 Tax=Oryza punctata TaxID=4537 RepID=A0A0E0K4S1_ORYPU